MELIFLSLHARGEESQCDGTEIAINFTYIVSITDDADKRGATIRTTDGAIFHVAENNEEILDQIKLINEISQYRQEYRS